MGDAAVHWDRLQEGRGIPAEIRAQAPADPWGFDPAAFRAPAVAAETPSRSAALDLLGEQGTVLDVGCGGGTAAFALAAHVGHLTGTDTQQDMLELFAAEAAARGIPHRTVLGTWPQTAAAAGRADVVVSHMVLHNVVDLPPFVTALSAAARRGVVVEMMCRHPMAWLDPLWEQFHGLRRPPPATDADAVAVLRECGIEPEVAHGSALRRHLPTRTGSAGGSASPPNGRRRWRPRCPDLLAPTGSPPSAGLCEGRPTCADTVPGGAGGGMTSLATTLGIASAVVLVGVLAVRASTRIGLPSLLLYLGIGVLLGEAVFGIPFSDARLTESLGLAALVLILVEGGLTTRWAAVRPALGVGLALSTVAVAVSIGVVGVALHLLLDLEWRTAFLWGAVLSSTDAAAVFSVLRGIGVGKRLVGALELESGFNDAPVVIAVMVLASDAAITWVQPLLVVYELGAGAVIGAALGWASGWALIRIALPSTGLYPLAAIAACVLAYAAGQTVHASGLLATYVAALVLGNSALPHRDGVRSFAEGTGWLAQIGLFVLLGLYSSPVRLLDALVPALVAGAVLLLVARPLSVWMATVPFRVPWRDQAFLAWAGLRGAVPIVLALIAFTAGAPGAQTLVDVVFVLVVLLTLLQGTTLPWVARRLKISRASEPREMEVDAAPLDALGADLLQITVPVGSRLRGVYLRELRLPSGATVSLVVRGGEAFTPTLETRLREGDQFLVVTTQAAREAAEERIRAVDLRGRLARWNADRAPKGDTG